MGEEVWYVIIFAILVLAIVACVTWLAYEYHTFNQASTDPNLQCYTDYTCPYSVACAPGQTDYKTCWPGVTALYAPILGTCVYPDTGLPPNCDCSFEGTGANCLTET